MILQIIHSMSINIITDTINQIIRNLNVVNTITSFETLLLDKNFIFPNLIYMVSLSLYAVNIAANPQN